MSAYDSTLDTLAHRESVGRNILVLVIALQHRALHHDRSKLLPPEKDIFDHYPNHATPEIGTPEYEERRLAMGSALEHHYAANRHHPEFHAEGIDGMTLVDVLEMFADWVARIEERLEENPNAPAESLEYCRERFGVSEQLHHIFANTYLEHFASAALRETLAA